MHHKVIVAVLFGLGAARAAVTLSAGPVRLLEYSEQVFIQPLWSQDGRYIACTGEHYQGIWVVRLEDRQVRRLSDAPAAGFGMAWSNDSRSLVSRVANYEALRRSNALQLFDVESQTSRLLCAYQTEPLGLPVWSADDRHVYAAVNNTLQSFSTGKPATPLSKKAPSRVAYLQGDRLAFYDEVARSETSTWGSTRIINLTACADGSKIAFEIMGGPMCVMNSDGSGYLELGEGHRPRWSPDGRYLVYMITQDDGDQLLASDLYVIKADGSEKQALTATPAQLEMNPCWSPDGDRIAYDDAMDGALYLLTISGLHDRKE
ncbi:MAG: translocation protein TolB [bacterium ADurb.Bin478]|nr:MAG: translocation protein TolB [bacterium ADurb.Bin478]